MANLEMIVWDVQHGNAIYVRTPNGKHLVFDLVTGDYSGKNQTFSPLSMLWHAYNVRHIDYLVITHPHRDHIDDILSLDAFSPSVFNRPRTLNREEVLAGVTQQDRPKFEKYLEYHERYIGDITGSPNDTSIPANYGGVSFQHFMTPTLSTSNKNNHSLVTVLDYLGAKIVIPGDNECASLELLMERQDFKDAIKDCEILIAPHHGRDSGCHTNFIDHANPRISIVSDGSFCDTSANPTYSAKSRGWSVRKRSNNTYADRKLLTTNSDGEVYITISPSSDPRYSRVLGIEIP